MSNKGRGVHVTPHNNDGRHEWQVKQQGAQRASKVFGTQAEAREFGRQTAINNASELYVHRANGTIGERNSYGKDKCPPRG